MARAALQVGVRELASTAGVSAMTITRFETGQTKPQQAKMAAIQSALEASGVVFIDPNGGGPGVRLK